MKHVELPWSSRRKLGKVKSGNVLNVILVANRSNRLITNTNYRKVFLGFLFLFDFRIGGLDILPDIIGFILIVIGLKALLGRSDFFQKAKNVAIPLIGLSIFDIYQQPIGSSLAYESNPDVFTILLGLATSALMIVMVYGICMGIREEAESLSLNDIADKAVIRWKLYLVTISITTVGLIIPIIIGILFIPLFILICVSYVLIMSLLKQAERTIWDKVSYPIKL